MYQNIDLPKTETHWFRGLALMEVLKVHVTGKGRQKLGRDTTRLQHLSACNSSHRHGTGTGELPEASWRAQQCYKSSIRMLMSVNW